MGLKIVSKNWKNFLTYSRYYCIVYIQPNKKVVIDLSKSLNY